MKDLNIRKEAIEILEKKAGKNLFDLCGSNFLLNTPSLRGKGNKSKNELLGPHQNKKFRTAKETISKTKRQPTEWEKIFANDTSGKELVSKIHKELIKLNSQKTNNPMKKWAKDMNRHFSKEDIRMAN